MAKNNLFKYTAQALGKAVPTFSDFMAGVYTVGAPTQEQIASAYGAQAGASAIAPPANNVENAYGTSAPTATPTTPTTPILPTQEQISSAYGAQAGVSAIAPPSIQPPANNAENAYGTSAPSVTPPTPTTPILPTQAQMAAAYGEQTSTERLLDQKLAAAYGNAEEARKKAIADARSNRAMAQAAYGRNAEALASSGLYRSGVSDYVDANAHAAEIAAAKSAYETEAAARTAADNAYYDAKIAYAEQEKKKEAAAEQSKETEASTKNKAYLDLMDSAKSGGYSADEIRTAAGKLGITDEADIEALVKIAEDAYGEAEYNKIASSGTITSDTSDDELRGMIDRGELPASKLSQATAERDAQVEADFSVLYQSSGADAAFNYIDKQYNAGKYSKAEYQETYYNAVVADLQSMDGSAKSVIEMIDKIDKYAKDGKLTAADAENMKKYIESLVPRKAADSFTYYAASKRMQVEFNGHKYNGYASAAKSSEVNEINDLGIDAIDGNVVEINDNVYIYYRRAGGWLKFRGDIGGGGISSELTAPRLTIPAHSVVTGPSRDNSNGNSTSGGIDVGPIK